MKKRRSGLPGNWDSLRSAVAKGWRVRPAEAHDARAVSLSLRQLEDRRVLSADVAVAAELATALAGAVSDPAPGNSSQAATSNDSPASAAALQQLHGRPNGDSLSQAKGPISSPTAQSLADDEGPLTLTVPPDQQQNEGAVLKVENIGQFVSQPSFIPLVAVPLASGPFQYTIDWGDGTTPDTGTATIDVPGSEETATEGSFDGEHIYADNGVYTITIILTDNEGNVAGGQLTATIENVPPTLTVASDQTVNEGATLTVPNIGQFSDPGFDNPLNVGGETSEQFSYAIDWGDGTSIDSGSPVIDVPGAPGVPTSGHFDGQHIYADNGVYTVSVTISDDDGGSTTDTFTVTVDNVAPTLTVAPNQTVDEGATLTVPNIGQFTDPGFDNPLNVGGETSEQFSYAIDWGDGTPADSGSATIDTPGGPGVPTAGSFDGQHIYADNGVYTVTVTISDDDGGSMTDTFTVTVENVAPSLTVAPDQTTSEGSVLSITNIGQFTDPGFNNPLNVGGETSEQFSYAIDWGDGTPVDSGLPTIDVPGGSGVPTAGSFDGQHIYADNGVYTVTVTISDDDGGSTTSTLTVTVGNVAPTLQVPPNQTVNEGATLNLPNVGQFTDPGFDNPLNVGGETSEQFSYAIDWGDGTPVDSGLPTIDVPGGPGAPTAGSFDGSHIYADNGVYTVSVTISDDDGGSTTKTFEVTVNNVAPTLQVPANQTVNEGATLNLPNIGQFTDPGFNNPANPGGATTETFTYSINWGDGSAADAGNATIDVLGDRGVPTAGSFDGSHIYADNGVYTVSVTVKDDDGGETTKTFEVTVNNVAPTLQVPGNQTVNEGSTLSLTNIGQFTDPGFDNPSNPGGATSETFTYSINWGDGTSTDAGNATIDMIGGKGVSTAGSFDGSHIYADNGVYTVSVTVKDDDGGVTTKTFEVTVNNVAPTLEVPGNQTVNEGSTLSLTNIGQFTDPGFNNPLNIGGETSETFEYTIDWGDGTASNTGAATIDTPGGPGVPTAGSFDGAHVYADNGVYTVSVTIKDDDGGETTKTFEVTVNNVAPTLQVPANQTVNEGATLNLPNIGQFTDPGFDNPLNEGGETTETFDYTIDWGDGTTPNTGAATVDTPGSPGVLTSGSFDGSHIYADNGVYTVTVTVKDDDGGSATKTFEVTVNNVAPTLQVPANQTVDEGATLNLPNIGKFTDPAFDNPLNPSGPTTETFTYSINWGDGTPADTGNATIDTPGDRGVPTAGSFDGSHIYADNGVYTVSVTVVDDDGGTTTRTFDVTVNNVAPTLEVAPNQTVNEGSLLTIPNIGQFTDPAFDNPQNPSGPTSETFTYSINWGDGTAADAGNATIDAPGDRGVPTSGSFDGSHIYADNGVYTVTVTVVDDDGGTTVQTFEVTVNNVAPTLDVVGDQKVAEQVPLSITDIGKFTDPGFDNPLNVGGETTERFTYAVDWGDNTSVDSGPGTIDTAGGANQLTLGSFDAVHTYQHGGVYTVTVTISDDDGGSATSTFLVFVGPTLNVAPNQTVNEGAPLTITNIGQFTDPTPDRLDPDGPNDQPYTFSIDWGDGRPADTGLPAIDSSGALGVPTAGTFNGQHIYADNGVYTVTVRATAGDGRADTSTFTVTVNNVAPTLVVPPDQTVAQTRPFTIDDIGRFTDPGFDNLLNKTGETTERFTFTIQWGDGTSSSGAGVIQTPGQPGVLTAGDFDGSHRYAASGTVTVTVTVRDDDGGSATGSFQITVASIVPQNLIFLPPAAGAALVTVRPTEILEAVQPVALDGSDKTSFQDYRGGSVAGAESRLVLRIVTPAGTEDKDNDEPLAPEVLDNLRKLFGRLPDGHYRIYQIQADGIERLVVDVLVREGRSMDAADDADSLDDALPEAPLQPQTLPAEPAEPAEPEVGSDPMAVLKQTPATNSTWMAGGAALALTASHRRLRAAARETELEEDSSKLPRLRRRLR